MTRALAASDGATHRHGVLKAVAAGLPGRHRLRSRHRYLLPTPLIADAADRGEPATARLAPVAKEPTMDHPLFVLAAILIALVIFDLASYRWGADSRHNPEDRRSRS